MVQQTLHTNVIIFYFFAPLLFLPRGGLGMTEALLELLPDSPVYHIGMYRNPGSNIPVQYYNRLPKGHPSDVALILDPIIASCKNSFSEQFSQIRHHLELPSIRGTGALILWSCRSVASIPWKVARWQICMFSFSSLFFSPAAQSRPRSANHQRRCIYRQEVGSKDHQGET